MYYGLRRPNETAGGFMRTRPLGPVVTRRKYRGGVRVLTMDSNRAVNNPLLKPQQVGDLGKFGLKKLKKYAKKAIKAPFKLAKKAISIPLAVTAGVLKKKKKKKRKAMTATEPMTPMIPGVTDYPQAGEQYVAPMSTGSGGGGGGGGGYEAMTQGAPAEGGETGGSKILPLALTAAAFLLFK